MIFQKSFYQFYKSSLKIYKFLGLLTNYEKPRSSFFHLQAVTDLLRVYSTATVLYNTNIGILKNYILINFMENEKNIYGIYNCICSITVYTPENRKHWLEKPPHNNTPVMIRQILINQLLTSCIQTSTTHILMV